ncbi:MAG: site-specific integrase [Methanobrevibacter sp.]|nr:site-specific integrase [Methanobrevibacter sp.]
MGRGTVYNDNLTNDWENVSEQNRRLVRDFIQYCKSNDKSPQTVKQYEEWLKVFFCWNYTENDDKFFINLKRRDFVYYFGWCRDHGMSANRIATLKSVLSSLSTEIELLYEDLYPNFHNQLRALEPVHIAPVRQKTVISDEEMAKILQGLVDSGEYQVACYLALACASGSRKAELLQMRVDFFTSEHEVFNGYMYCTPEIRTKGRGKQGKMIKKYVIKELFDPFLNLWLEKRKELKIDTPYLFVTKHDKGYVPATISTANSFAKKISKSFDIEYYAHSSRHFFCTSLKRMKLPDDIITQIFGWANSDMVKVYSDIPAEEMLGEFFTNFKIPNKDTKT